MLDATTIVGIAGRTGPFVSFGYHAAGAQSMQRCPIDQSLIDPVRMPVKTIDETLAARVGVGLTH